MAHRNRATPPAKAWEPPPGGWRTPNADAALIEMVRQLRASGALDPLQTQAAGLITAMWQALQPFARISLRHDTDPTGPDMIEAPDLAITPNDVRRARRALVEREG
jgi:hypothetical protein